LGKRSKWQVELEGEGDEGMERALREMGDRGAERGSPLISGRSERVEKRDGREDCKQGTH